MTFTNRTGSVAKLSQYGMHFDDLNRIRVLDEDTANQVKICYLPIYIPIQEEIFFQTRQRN